MSKTTVDLKRFDELDLKSVVQAAKILHIGKTMLYKILEQENCPIDTYKPTGKLLVDMNSAKKWFLSKQVNKKVKTGAPRKR